MKLIKTKFAMPGIMVVFLMVSSYVGIAQVPTVTISVPDTAGPPGGAITVPVNVDDATDIAGVDITLTLDPNILTATGAETTDLTQEFFLVANPVYGQITIALARAAGITSGSGPIVNVNFDIDASVAEGDTSPVMLASAALYDENADLIGSTPRGGTFTVSASSSPGEF